MLKLIDENNNNEFIRLILITGDHLICQNIGTHEDDNGETLLLICNPFKHIEHSGGIFLIDYLNKNSEKFIWIYKKAIIGYGPVDQAISDSIKQTIAARQLNEFKEDEYSSNNVFIHEGSNSFN